MPTFFNPEMLTKMMKNQDTPQLILDYYIVHGVGPN